MTEPVPVAPPSVKRATPKSMIFTVPSTAEEDVGGLDVAVDDADLVRVGQAVQHLQDHDRPSRSQRQRRGRARMALQQVLAPQQLHRDVGRAVVWYPEVENGDHVRVHDPRHRARLALEAGFWSGSSAICGQHHLERHVAVEQRVVGVVDDAHGALAELLDDFVAADARARAGGGAGPRFRIGQRDAPGRDRHATELRLDGMGPAQSNVSRARPRRPSVARGPPRGGPIAVHHAGGHQAHPAAELAAQGAQHQPLAPFHGPLDHAPRTPRWS